MIRKILLLLVYTVSTNVHAENITLHFSANNTQQNISKIWIYGCKSSSKHPHYIKKLEKSELLEIDLELFKEYDFFFRISKEREKHFHLQHNTFQQEGLVRIVVSDPNNLRLYHSSTRKNYLLFAELIKTKKTHSWYQYLLSLIYLGEKK